MNTEGSSGFTPVSYATLPSHGLSEDVLAEQVTFPPTVKPASKSRFEMVLSSKEHEMRHRGQLMLMQRQLSIVPHVTRQREAFAAQAVKV